MARRNRRLQREEDELRGLGRDTSLKSPAVEHDADSEDEQAGPAADEKPKATGFAAVRVYCHLAWHAYAVHLHPAGST